MRFPVRIDRLCIGYPVVCTDLCRRMEGYVHFLACMGSLDFFRQPVVLNLGPFSQAGEGCRSARPRKRASRVPSGRAVRASCRRSDIAACLPYASALASYRRCCLPRHRAYSTVCGILWKSAAISRILFAACLYRSASLCSGIRLFTLHVRLQLLSLVMTAFSPGPTTGAGTCPTHRRKR